MASVGLTSREACGDTVRNVMGCHLAGACPQEVLDITPWAKATHRLPAPPPVRAAAAPQVQGQLLGLRDRLRPGDVQRRRRGRDHAHASPTARTEAGFKVFIAGGLGANPHPAQALEDFTAREDLLPTIYSCLRTFDHYGNRDNKIRARMKWLVDSMGHRRAARAHLPGTQVPPRRERLAGRASREPCATSGDAPAGGYARARPRSDRRPYR